MKILKGLILIVFGIAYIVTPQIWAIAYIKATMTVGFSNLTAWVNFVGIMSMITAVAEIRSILVAIDKAIQKKQNPLT